MMKLIIISNRLKTRKRERKIRKLIKLMKRRLRTRLRRKKMPLFQTQRLSSVLNFQGQDTSFLPKPLSVSKIDNNS